jgi:hypothetical protein
MAERRSAGRRGRRACLAAAALAGLALLGGLVAGRERLEERLLLWWLGSPVPEARRYAFERLGRRGRIGVLGTILTDQSRTYQARLRDVSGVVRSMFKGREWGAVGPALLGEGFIGLETREVDRLTIREFILPRNLYLVPGGFPQEVHCRVMVDQRGTDQLGLARPGQVIDAEMLLVAEFNRPHSEVLIDAPYPPGTVGDLSLQDARVRQAASEFPTLMKIEISCCRKGYVSEPDPPFRFYVRVELERENAGKSFVFSAEAVDSPGADLSGPLESSGGGEWSRIGGRACR